MNPVAVGKGPETRVDRWKVNNIETPTSTMQLELSPGFVSPEPIYYVTPEYMNGFSLYPEALTNGEGIHFQQGNVPEPSSPMNGDASSPINEKTTPEDLKRLIRQQFEYYFSRENLTNDAYLGKYAAVHGIFAWHFYVPILLHNKLFCVNSCQKIHKLQLKVG